MYFVVVISNIKLIEITNECCGKKVFVKQVKLWWNAGWYNTHATIITFLTFNVFFYSKIPKIFYSKKVIQIFA